MSGLLGIGLDVVELSRIRRLRERYGERFVARFCRPEEVGRDLPAHRLDERLGGLFAAKEAVLKALGTGWARGLGLQDVEIVRLDTGQPGTRLHGAAARRLTAVGGRRVLVSITHERRYAMAVAILDGEDGR